MRRPDKVSWRGWKLIKSTPWKWTLLSYPRCQTSFAPRHLACWNCSSTNSNAKPFCLTSNEFNEWETCDFRRLWRLKLVCGTNRTWQGPNIQDQIDQIKETQRLSHLSQLGVSIGLQAKALLWGPLSALCSLQEVNSAGPFKANAIANEHHQPGVSETLEVAKLYLSIFPPFPCLWVGAGFEFNCMKKIWQVLRRVHAWKNSKTTCDHENCDRVQIALTSCMQQHATTCNNPVRNMKAFFELSRIQQEIVQLLGERDPQVQLKMLRYGCTRCPLQSVDSWHPSRNRVASLRADMARGLTSSRNCHAQGRLSQGAHQSTQRALTDQAGSL